jgi:hypothetical protein
MTIVYGYIMASTFKEVKQGNNEWQKKIIKLLDDKNAFLKGELFPHD